MKRLEQYIEYIKSQSDLSPEEQSLIVGSMICMGDLNFKKNRRVVWDKAFSLFDIKSLDFGSNSADIGRCLIDYAMMLDSKSDENRVAELKRIGSELRGTGEYSKWHMVKLLSDLRVDAIALNH